MRSLTPAFGAALIAVPLLAGCAYHPPPGGPWAAQMVRTTDCSGIDGVYANRGAFGQLTQDVYFTPILALSIQMTFIGDGHPLDMHAVSLTSQPDGLQVGALRDGKEMASVHVAKAALRCVDGWLVIKDTVQFADSPRRTNRDEEIISLRATQDGALVLRTSLALVPGDEISVSYERFARLR